jgi:hypothetical protein
LGTTSVSGGDAGARARSGNLRNLPALGHKDFLLWERNQNVKAPMRVFIWERVHVADSLATGSLPASSFQLPASSFQQKGKRDPWAALSLRTCWQLDAGS